MHASKAISIELHTPRLRFTEFTVGDFDALLGIFQRIDARGQRWANASARDPESVRRFLQTAIDDQAQRPRKTFRWALRMKTPEGWMLVGYNSLCDIDKSDQPAYPDTGIMLDPAVQGAKLAQEARLALALTAFGMGIKRLVSEVRIGNAPSENAIRHMGYTPALDDGGAPFRLTRDTIQGPETWARYTLTPAQWLEHAPRVTEKLSPLWRETAASVPLVDWKHALQSFGEAVNAGRGEARRRAGLFEICARFEDAAPA